MHSLIINRPYTLEGNEIMQELQSKQERIIAVS